jgi:hypothetical protein
MRFETGGLPRFRMLPSLSDSHLLLVQPPGKTFKAL